MTQLEIAKLFAGLTCLLEDMHAVVVEGQQFDLSPDMAHVLVLQAKEGFSAGNRLIAAIEIALS